MDAGIIERIRLRAGLKSDAVVGVRGSFGKDVEVDTSRGNRDLVVTANTDDIDLDEEVVVPAGADTGYFFANGKIFADHFYDIPHTVGSLRKAFPYPSAADHRGWKVRLRVASTPLGDDVLTLAREAGMGSSIGFEPLDYGPPTADEGKAYTRAGGKGPRSVVRRWKWLELSLTAMPCNVACQGGVVAVDDTRMAMLDELVTKGRIKRASAAAFGLADAQPRRRIVLMGLG